MKVVYNNKGKICIFILLVIILTSIPVSKAEAEIDFTKSGRVLSSKFNSIISNFEPDASMLIINMTEGIALEGKGVTEGYYSPDVKRISFLLAILHMNRLQEYATINEDGAVLLAGDIISVSELLKYYMYSEDENIKAVIMNYFSMDYQGIADEVNKIVKTDWIFQTKIARDQLSKKNQFTCAYDLYVLVNQLMDYKWFTENFGRKEIAIKWKDVYGNEKTKTISDARFGDISVIMPKGFTFAGHFTSKDSEGGSQIIITKNKEGNGYISVVIGKAIKDKLSYISKKILLTQTGEPYLTLEQEEALLNPTITPAPDPTLIPTGVPTKAPKPTDKPTPTPKPDGTGEKPTPKVTATPTPVPSSGGGYSTPTSSKSSVNIPKVNSDLEKYGAKILPVGNEDEKYKYLLGTSEIYYTFDKPPAGYFSEAEAAKSMITITVPVWRMAESGNKFSSKYDITINKKLAANVKALFEEIYKLPIKFPIKLLKGYSYREVGGVGLNNVTLMSMHSYGAAIDINPDDYDNDYYLGAGNDLRDKSNPFCIPDEVIEIFEKHGWNWGGNFNICADTMHFQYLGLDYLSYQGNNPFRELKVIKGYYRGTDVWNLQMRLKELGYKITVDGVYAKETESVVIKFQKKYGIEPTGTVDYKTWETLINLTHYLQYVF